MVGKNLPNLISEIRDALGDDLSEPPFIRTWIDSGTPFATRRVKAANTSLGKLLPVSVSSRRKGASYSTRESTLVGRDPDLEVLLDSASVSRRCALIRISSALGDRRGSGKQEWDVHARSSHRRSHSTR